MKGFVATLLLLQCFLLCSAQDNVVRGKNYLHEYMSCIQSGADVTPFVIGIKDMYEKTNIKKRHKFKEMIIEVISEQLSSNNKNMACSVINIYKMIAEQKDEQLPKLNFILGNIYAEQNDTVNLKSVIFYLKQYPTQTEDIGIYINTLSDHLQHIRNYKPVTYDLKGTWISDVTTEKSLSFPKYHLEIIENNDITRFKINGSIIRQHWTYFDGENSDKSYSQIDKAFGEDSLYLFWSSEKLSNADLETISMRQQLVGTAGTAVATSISNGSKNIEDIIGGQLVGGLTEIAVNALFDWIFKPTKRIIIIEAWLKKINKNMFTGEFVWCESKIKNNTTEMHFEETRDTVTLMRWDSESQVYLLFAPAGSEVKPKRYPNIGKYSSFDIHDYFPYVQTRTLKNSPNPELRQARQDYKNAKVNDKIKFFRNYNREQIEKLKKWCLEQN